MGNLAGCRCEDAPHSLIQPNSMHLCDHNRWNAVINRIFHKLSHADTGCYADTGSKECVESKPILKTATARAYHEFMSFFGLDILERPSLSKNLV